MSARLPDQVMDALLSAGGNAPAMAFSLSDDDTGASQAHHLNSHQILTIEGEQINFKLAQDGGSARTECFISSGASHAHHIGTIQGRAILERTLDAKTRERVKHNTDEAAREAKAQQIKPTTIQKTRSRRVNLRPSPPQLSQPQTTHLAPLAARKYIVHWLAVRPLPLAALEQRARPLGIDKRSLYELVQSVANLKSPGMYHLKDFREVDVNGWDYSEDERAMAMQRKKESVVEKRKIGAVDDEVEKKRRRQESIELKAVFDRRYDEYKAVDAQIRRHQASLEAMELRVAQAEAGGDADRERIELNRLVQSLTPHVTELTAKYDRLHKNLLEMKARLKEL